MGSSGVSSSRLRGPRVPRRAGQVSDVMCRQPPWGGGPKSKRGCWICFQVENSSQPVTQEELIEELNQVGSRSVRFTLADVPAVTSFLDGIEDEQS